LNKPILRIRNSFQRQSGDSSVTALGKSYYAATQLLLLPRQLFAATVDWMNQQPLLAKEKLRHYNNNNHNNSLCEQLLVAFVRSQLFFCKRVHWSKSKV
jgi:hypothetical protein